MSQSGTATPRRSAFADHPNYRVDLERCHERVTVAWQGEVLADSTRALRVRETAHDEVTYFPREDVHMSLLERTDHTSFCPFKGEASYFSIRVGDRVAENAVWTYEDPFDEVAGLEGYVAFWRERMKPA
jgi:uncharacterized protein (DUF427 family)